MLSARCPSWPCTSPSRHGLPTTAWHSHGKCPQPSGSWACLAIHPQLLRAHAQLLGLRQRQRQCARAAQAW
eukprot:6845552-Prorocentrum_lima.AAC.1